MQHLQVAALVGCVAAFSLGCNDTTAPTVGAIAVTIATSGAGPDLDPDGYSLSIDGGPGQAVAVNGAMTFGDLPPGEHIVKLDGLASNCAVGNNPRAANVVAGHGGVSTVPLTFNVACVARTGTVVITVATTGAERDMDGYYVFLRGEPTSRALNANPQPNASVTFSGLVPGNYILTLYGVAANCDALLPNPRTFAVGVGSPVPIAIDIVCEAPRQLAFVHGEGIKSEIHLVSSNGAKGKQLTDNSVEDLHPAWSPDGRRIAFTSGRDGNHEIYVMNADGTSPVRLTNAPARDSRPSWSPDGARIAFASLRDGNSEVYVMDADGTNPVRLTSSDAFDGEPAWSPDGRRIAFRSDRIGAGSIWLMDADGSRPVRMTSPTTREDRQPAWSADGTRIAFSRGDSGGRKIFMMNIDGSGLTSLTPHSDEEEDPSWAPNGRKIAMSTNDFYYGRGLTILNLQGTPFAPVTFLDPVFNPVWQP